MIRLYKKMGLMIFITLLSLNSAFALADICRELKGASIVAQDEKNTFLGKISNSYDTNSIFNKHGLHGNTYGNQTIWNKSGLFGGKYQAYSPYNTYSQKPPMIIKDGNIIGLLSESKSLSFSGKKIFSPDEIKTRCKSKF